MAKRYDPNKNPWDPQLRDYGRIPSIPYAKGQRGHKKSFRDTVIHFLAKPAPGNRPLNTRTYVTTDEQYKREMARMLRKKGG